MTPRARFGTIAATLAAAGIAAAWFLAGYPSLIYDSLGYYILAAVVRAGGIAHWPTDTWTYGYPLFAALVTGWRQLPPEEFRLILFAAQLLVWLAACALVARRLATVLRSPGAGAAAYAIGALNPVLLVQTTEPLSDLLSAALVVTAVALAWRDPGEPEPEPSLWRPFLSLAAAGASAAVRPANVVVAAVVAGVWVLRALIFRDLRLSHGAAGVAGLVPPFLPQAAINYLTFGFANPLIRKNLYHLQTTWGMSALKYATLVIPGRSPFLVYGNPLYRGDASPAAFFRAHPVHYLGTLALHGFGLLDRDLPFTYVTDLEPWYRTPLALANFLVLYLAAAGAAIGLLRLARRRRVDEAAFVVVSTAAVAGAYLALYLPVEVECRFGVALQALATPFIVAGAMALRGRSPRRRLTRIVVLVAAPFAVAGALALSAKIAKHRTNPYVETSPANAVVMGPTRTRRTPAAP
ncbi:MAG TPA: hypothetical protein VMH79_14495 [Thermoanaerobaculia bacterium]|nr:hypothetical protein [Thermoanaerobaculia bacterium]